MSVEAQPSVLAQQVDVFIVQRNKYYQRFLLLVFISYLVALYLLWQQFLILPLVIATGGYVIFRMLYRLCFNLTWSHFLPQQEYADMLALLDSSMAGISDEELRSCLLQSNTMTETSL